MSASTNYFTDVQRRLAELGEPVALTADECDVIDDYANQDFGAKECADRIAQDRN